MANGRAASLYSSRRRTNRIAVALAIAATLFGLTWLVLILAVALAAGLLLLDLRLK